MVARACGASCRGGAGAGSGAGGEGLENLTEDERAAFEAATEAWEEQHAKHVEWAAKVRAAEKRLLLQAAAVAAEEEEAKAEAKAAAAAAKAEKGRNPTEVERRPPVHSPRAASDSSGLEDATTRRALAFWAPSVAVGVVATVPVVSGATVALFLPAFFLLLLVRTATVETDDAKFVQRQDKIVSETKAEHRLRLCRFLGRTTPM